MNWPPSLKTTGRVHDDIMQLMASAEQPGCEFNEYKVRDST